MAITRLSLFLIFASLVLIIIIIDLTRRKKLEEKISLLWMSIASGMFVVSLLGDKVLKTVSNFMQEEQSFIITIFSLTCLMFLILALSIRESKHKKKISALSQEIGILKQKIDELEKK